MTAGTIDNGLAKSSKPAGFPSRLFVLHVRVADIQDNVRWERSRGGELFPHLYGEWHLSAIDHAEAART